MKVIDLDILRPEQQIIRLNEKDIDVSFIPVGVTFEVDKIVNELVAINSNKMNEGGAEAMHAFQLAIQLCAVFCAHQYPEMNEDWFMKNTNPMQIQAFAQAIQSTLSNTYAGVMRNSKNARAPKKTKNL